MHDATTGRHRGLPHDPFEALVAPLPIGRVASLGPGGVANLAPFSFFDAVSDRPWVGADGCGARVPKGRRDGAVADGPGAREA